MTRVVERIQMLPDTNNDGQLILMTQDNFMLRFLGVRSVMIPNEDRDTVLEVAQRYAVDYILMPAGRPAVDTIYVGTETDLRFVQVLDMPELDAKVYRFDFDAGHTPP
jgi:hypothetical protein